MLPKSIGNPEGQASYTPVKRKRGSTGCSGSASSPRYNFRVRPINSQPPSKKPRRDKHPSPLLKLPSELVLLVAEQIDDVKDLCSLILVNRCLASLLQEKDLLQRFAMVEDQPRLYESKLLWAVSVGHTQLVKRLLRNRNNADYVNTKNFLNKTALSIAASLGDEWVVRLLLENGASVSTRCQHLGRSPLHYALLTPLNSNSVKIVQLLLEHGADPSIGDLSGCTPIFYLFIWSGAPDVVTALIKLMLNKGANIARVSRGRTLLHHAVDARNEQAVRLLLDYGADITAVDTSWRTALERDKIWTSDDSSGVMRALLERWPIEVPLPDMLPKYQRLAKAVQGNMRRM